MQSTRSKSEPKVNYSWIAEYMKMADIAKAVQSDGSFTSLPFLKTNSNRQEFLDYFNNSWALTEMLFSSLISDEAFFRIPYHGLRHPMLFYYGHVAVLYVNKLRVAQLIDKPVDSHIESAFETGIDEMLWDDIPAPRTDWPTLSQVRAYRERVYNMITDIIKNHPDIGKKQINQSHSLWSLVMAFEHERIHLETSSVLIRELPLSLVKTPQGWPDFEYNKQENFAPEINISYPQNQLVNIDQQEIELGKPENHPTFGWDNEYGYKKHKVNKFQVGKFLVSNGQFYEFVRDNGYHQDHYWSKSGLNWRKFRNIKNPTFWVSVGPAGLNHYQLRTIFKQIPMQWNWPVVVNYHEASAFCAWQSEKP